MLREEELASFANEEDVLRQKIEAVVADRRAAGLEGLTGGLEAVGIVTEPDRQRPAVEEFLRTSGYEPAGAFSEPGFDCVRLTQEGSADFLFRVRTGEAAASNPFAPFGDHPTTRAQPNTRIEAFIYKCRDVRAYHRIQTERGVAFPGGVVETDAYRYVQTAPSDYTGYALGFVEWLGEEGAWEHSGCAPLDLDFPVPDIPYRKNFRHLDHTAARVRAEDRDPAILEFLSLTSYNFEFAIYVEVFNSITNVARLTLDDYAQVFTSGIKPFVDLATSGPTEKFIHNYGQRVHHMAFHTEEIEATYAGLKADGMQFLIELVGSPEEGLKQTFTKPSPHTFLVTEYIHRYGDFTGFFTRSNVTALTGATDKQ